MFPSRKVQPAVSPSESSQDGSSTAKTGRNVNSLASKRWVDHGSDSISTVSAATEECYYLKLKPFTEVDPSLGRLLSFMKFFGIILNFGPNKRTSSESVDSQKRRAYFKMALMITVCIVTSEVVYDINLCQSKLLAEQKRSTPLLTFVIVAYSWLTLLIPFTCIICMIMMGTQFCRFYSRTMATVCDGALFGQRTFVDSWLYYTGLVTLALTDSIGQLIVLGVWPSWLDPYVSMASSRPPLVALNFNQSTVGLAANLLNTASVNTSSSSSNVHQPTMGSDLFGNQSESLVKPSAETSALERKRIRTVLLDSLLGDNLAHSDLGVYIKMLCLIVQFIYSYGFLLVIILLADHYANAINHINETLRKSDFQRLLKQLIVLRDSSEQVSLLISTPFALMTLLIFMRQIALNGVFIQSSMHTYENMAVVMQSTTSAISIIMVYIYCDRLQSTSRQTHRLKTEQTVVNDNLSGDQSTYEFLDYLNRLSKSIRITFFNIITIDKSSLVGLSGHVLTLTFVTS